MTSLSVLTTGGQVINIRTVHQASAKEVEIKLQVSVVGGAEDRTRSCPPVDVQVNCITHLRPMLGLQASRQAPV